MSDPLEPHEVDPYDANSDDVTGAIMGPDPSEGTTAKGDGDQLPVSVPAESSSSESKRSEEDKLSSTDPPPSK